MVFGGVSQVFPHCMSPCYFPSIARRAGIWRNHSSPLSLTAVSDERPNPFPKDEFLGRDYKSPGFFVREAPASQDVESSCRGSPQWFGLGSSHYSPALFPGLASGSVMWVMEVVV